MLPKPESACFVIADISGNTGFLTGVELEHAQDIIAEIMDTMVRRLRAALARSLDECGSVPEGLRSYERERLQPNIDAVEFGRYLGSFIELGLAGPTSDPDLDLSYEFIIRECARLPRVRPPHRAGLSKERVLQ